MDSDDELSGPRVLARLDAAADRMGLHLPLPDLLILATAQRRIDVDGEDEQQVVRWAREELGLEDNLKQMAALRASGASIRQIGERLMVPRTTVARRLSQIAA